MSVEREHVLAKCDYFTDVQLWPLREELDTRGWLQNFHADELEHACALLNAFVYYSRRLVDEMFIASFQQLSVHVVDPASGYLTACSAWQAFTGRVLVTHVEGEQPNTTDSGYMFSRRARQLLDIDPRQILSPDEALAHLITNGTRPVVFVDDFVGSGSQFKTSWQRRRALKNGVDQSFKEFSHSSGGDYFYCPLLCTQSGEALIDRECSGVRLLPIHRLTAQRDGALSNMSLLWPERLRATGAAFVEAVSKRAGIPETGSASWRGYGDLGLTVAFEHSVPDATLPIFYWEDNGWNPLLRRR